MSRVAYEERSTEHTHPDSGFQHEVNPTRNAVHADTVSMSPVCVHSPAVTNTTIPSDNARRLCS